MLTALASSASAEQAPDHAVAPASLAARRVLRHRAVAIGGAVLGLALGAAAPAAAGVGLTTMQSRSSAGTQGDAASRQAAISADGRVTAFVSGATNLVAGDDNGTDDVFVHDAADGTTTRVSVASDGAQADGFSSSPKVSGNGRHVAFESSATNLVAGDGNGMQDVFVRDRQTGTTIRLSVPPAGEADGFSSTPDISADGRYVAFTSSASNLVAGDTNNRADVFVVDRDADGDGVFDEAGDLTTTRVSVAGDGTQGDGLSSNPAISADGGHVAFSSIATNLVSGDTNRAADVFVHDRAPGATTRVSVASDGTQATGFSSSPDISADGRHVVFQSTAGNLTASDTNFTADIFVRDRDTDADATFDEPGETRTARVSVAGDGTQASGFSNFPSVSDDGRRVAFYSFAPNLAPGASGGQIFVRDRDADADASFDEADAGATSTSVESVASDGTPADALSIAPAIAGDGARVAFESNATNLVPNDADGFTDVFVHRLSAPAGQWPLSVHRDGDGSGSVASTPAGIDCGTTCVAFYDGGAEVTLTPSAGSGSSFSGFGGACTGTGPCTVTVDQARSVTATFDLVRHGVTVARPGDGQGRVTSSPEGIDCGSDCAHDFVEGTTVTLSAAPAIGSHFAGWGGACSGSAACTVSASRPRAVTATFDRDRRALTVAMAGDGRGTVTSSPAGIACGPECGADFVQGSEVLLTATPSTGSDFAGWSGACSGVAECRVTMSRARSVTATFELGGGEGPRPPAAPPARAGGSGTQGDAAGRKATAKLEVARSRVLRSARRLDVLAPITALASGRVQVELHAAGRRLRFTERVDRANGIRFRRSIPASQARMGTGILTITYGGDDDTRPQEVRLRAAARPANLRLARPTLVDGRLRATGTIADRARGVVRMQVEWVVDGTTRRLKLRAPIRDGRWEIDERLSQDVRDSIARRTGTVHSYTLFTGYLRARMRGEMQSFQILGAR